jgi:methyl-accepting chemotaxis protein
MHPKRNRLLLAISAVILLVIVGLSYNQWRQYAVANAEARRARDVTQSVERLFLTLVDAETGQRGFLLTGEDRYLEPYSRAIQSIPVELSQLTGLLALRPSESANVSRLSSLVNDKLSELRQTISLRQTQGTAPALDIVLSDDGKRRMDEIRTVCSEIQANESVLWNQAAQ